MPVRRINWTLLLALGAVLASTLVEAQQATSLSAIFAPNPCPDPCQISQTHPGFAVPLQLFGHDASGNVATGYLGTVTFSSTDLFATLPSPYTFTAQDAGGHSFQVTFQSVGSQTVTITDSVNGFVTSAPMLVIASSAAPIPATTNQTKLGMICLLGLVGAWLASRPAA